MFRIFRMEKILLFILMMVPLLLPVRAEAGWLFFHEPEFKGKVVDIDTKEPIVGAVVVAVYYKKSITLAPEAIDSAIHVAETLTNVGGAFILPSYSRFIGPLSWEIATSFIILKPGYGSLNRIKLADYFSGKDVPEEVGMWPYPEYQGLIYKIRYPGIVELPKLTTPQQVAYSSNMGITGFGAKELPLLYKAKRDASHFRKKGHLPQ